MAKAPIPKHEAVASRRLMGALWVERVVWQGDDRRALRVATEEGLNPRPTPTGGEGLFHRLSVARQLSEALEGV